MTRKPSKTPIADLHTPDELLENAKTLLATKNPKMMRAAILEAITALEAFVQKTVFENLQGKLDPLLVIWLEDKTKMDFDSRLSVLTPVAIGKPINKESDLWENYKKSKSLRNRITHSGEIVSEDDAKFVIDTVHSWLAYLGRTVNLELALMQFRRYVEDNNISIKSEKDANQLIIDYFGRTQAAQAEAEVPISIGNDFSFRADVILKFGDTRVVIEHKIWRSSQFAEYDLSNPTIHANSSGFDINNPIYQVVSMISATESTNTPIAQGAVIIFQSEEIPERFNLVQKLLDGKVYLLIIKTEN